MSPHPKLGTELMILTRGQTDRDGRGEAASYSSAMRYTVFTGPRQGEHGLWQPPRQLARQIEQWLLPAWSAPVRAVPSKGSGRTAWVSLNFDISLEDRKAALDAVRAQRDAEAVAVDTVRGRE